MLLVLIILQSSGRHIGLAPASALRTGCTPGNADTGKSPSHVETHSFEDSDREPHAFLEYNMGDHSIADRSPQCQAVRCAHILIEHTLHPPLPPTITDCLMVYSHLRKSTNMKTVLPSAERMAGQTGGGNGRRAGSTMGSSEWQVSSQR